MSSLLKSSSVVGLMTLVSRVLGLVREMMLTRMVGAGGGMDAFLVALMIPNFGRRMFAEGAFSQAFVPVFTETKTTRPHEEVQDLEAVVMGTLGGVLTLVTVIGCLCAPLLVWMFASGFADDPAKELLSRGLLRWTFPYLMFISLTSMAGGVLNAYGRFAVPAFTPVIFNLCIIASAWIDSGSVQALAWAVFAGGIFQFLFQLPSLARLRLLPRPYFSLRDARVRRIVSLMLPMMLGSSVAQLSLLLNSNLSTHLGDGSVSWLYFANRLMEFPLGIFSIAVGTAILPALSAHHATDSREHFSSTLDWSLRTILVIGVPAALGLTLLAGPLVATLFGGGRFGERDVAMTTYALWAYAFGFLGFSFVKVLVPGFYARQQTALPARYAIISLVIGMAVSLALFAWSRVQHWGAAHVALAFSTSLSAWINSALLYRKLRRDGVYTPAPQWGRYALQLALASIAMSGVVAWMSAPLSHWMAAGTWLRVGWTSEIIFAAIVVYASALWLCGLRPAQFRRH
ncbi:MAG TPA: murein biosynthesis integral membrane protein MurJ [Nevskiaceae bacterium]|nr:murein biosynthesis integral membrane protein MurJ [Nevskiaceae bacterium]